MNYKIRSFVKYFILVFILILISLGVFPMRLFKSLK